MPILGVKLKLFSLFRGEDACFRGENLHVWDENGLYGVNDALEKCCDRWFVDFLREGIDTFFIWKYLFIFKDDESFYA